MVAESGGHVCLYTISGNTVAVSNRWVVPYNAYLLLRYKCHINVEIVNNFKVVKYLYKYIYKGTSKAVVAQREEMINSRGEYVIDEIERYQVHRYFGPTEATWRIYGYRVSEYFPPVKRLQIHLPNEQHMTFGEDEIVEALETAEVYGSMLLAFFEAIRMEMDNPPEPSKMSYNGAILPPSSELRYKDFPNYFTFLPGNKAKRIRCKWQRTKRGRSFSKNGTIGRMYFVSPTSGDLFFLRTLLCHVKGPISYESLRTYNDVLYPTFKDACIARGLFHDDEEWKNCLAAAVLCATKVSDIRVLFAVILYYNEPENPLGLWEEFKNGMSEDFKYQRKKHNPNSNSFTQEDYDRALIHLERLIKSFSGGSKSISDYKLPLPNLQYGNIGEQLFDPIVEANTLEEQKEQMNTDQRALYDLIISRITATSNPSFEEPLNLFIDAPGGTGKTFLLNNVLRYMLLHNIPFVSSAYSGIAASLLREGRTVHSWFKLPLHCRPPVQSSLGLQTQQAVHLRDTKVIIIDEAPMLHKYQLQAIHNLLNEIEEIPPNNKDQLFANKLVILAGDFRQTLPVIPKEVRAGVVESLIKQSYLWQTFTSHTLTINERVLRIAKTLPDTERRPFEDFSKFVLDVGNGSTGQTLTISPNFVYQSRKLKMFLKWVYPEFRSNYVQSVDDLNLHERAILCATNADVDFINEIAVSMMKSTEIFTLKSADSTETAELGDLHANVTTEVLNSLTVTGVPPHELILRTGAPLMLLRNLNIADGLCNGTKLEFIDIYQNYLMRAKVVSGPKKGETVLIPRIKFFVDSSKMLVNFCRVQFPVKLAFAMTINKSQGQTLQKVGIYLPSAVFSHGQLYVAVSRCANPSAIKFFIPSHAELHDQHKLTDDYTLITTNEVWQECFQ